MRILRLFCGDLNVVRRGKGRERGIGDCWLEEVCRRANEEKGGGGGNIDVFEDMRVALGILLWRLRDRPGAWTLGDISG